MGWPGEMVAEVQRQFSKVDSKGKTLLTGSTELKPDSKTCIQISTQAEVAEPPKPPCQAEPHEHDFWKLNRMG